MRTLRVRLTLGVTAVLAVVLLVAGLTASRYFERSEREALDDRLERTAELSAATARAAIQEELPEGDRRLDAVLSASSTSLRLLLGETVLLETGRPPASQPPARRGMRTFVSDGRSYRSLTTTVRDPDLGGLALLEVTTSLEALERRQADLDRRLIVLGLLALLAAGVGTWLTANLMLRPLLRLRQTASSIAGDEDLQRRVPEGEGPSELRSLAVSFNAMLARLGASSADRARALAATRRFAADAGHELRTPLTTVLGTLSSLRRHPDLDEARRAAMLDDALAEHRRLVDLLDGLQSIARGDAPLSENTDVDLGELAVAAAERHPDRTLDVSVPVEPVQVRGWEPGLRLVVDNLIDNAVVHGPPGGRIRLVVSSADGNGAGPTLRVEDEGPGVPEAERTRVFEPFVRLDAGERPGSGLGLALVAQQVHHQGGTVTVDDSPLGGARFTVRLPADDSAV